MTNTSTRTDFTSTPRRTGRPTHLPPEWATPGPVAVITASVFLGPWLIWGSRIAEGQGALSWHLPTGIALWSIWPLLTLSLLATGGPGALADLWSRLLRWRVPTRWYLVALLTPPLAAAATVGVASVTGVRLHPGANLSFTGALVYLCYGVGLFLLTEEAAWRGALLPRLQSRLSPMTASLLLGVVWTTWHVPSLHVPGETDQGLSLPVFAVLVTATTILITALVNAAGGSVIIAAVFHASFDAAYAYTGVVGGDPRLLLIATALTVAAAACVSIRTRGRLCAPSH